MYNLERVTNMDSLYRSWQKISQNKANPGVDNIDISFYRSDLQRNLRSLQTSVSTGNYRPFADKVFNHKDRKISISCVDDKIIQTALSEVITDAHVPVKSVHGFMTAAGFRKERLYYGNTIHFARKMLS